MKPVSDNLEFATRHGSRQAEAILDAAYRCLAEHGFSGTSMQRIAESAGVNKRMLHYYFGSRERLFEQVVRVVGGRLLDQVEQAISEVEEPADVMAVGFDRVWHGVTADPQLQAVYLGLLAESATDPSLRTTIADIKNGYRDLFGRLVGRLSPSDLPIEAGALTVLVTAGMQGLALEYIEQGETPELRAAVACFRDILTTLTGAPTATEESA